jgi:hypothetical protein
VRFTVNSKGTLLTSAIEVYDQNTTYFTAAHPAIQNTTTNYFELPSLPKAVLCCSFSTSSLWSTTTSSRPAQRQARHVELGQHGALAHLLDQGEQRGAFVDGQREVRCRLLHRP